MKTKEWQSYAMATPLVDIENEYKAFIKKNRVAPTKIKIGRETMICLLSHPDFQNIFISYKVANHIKLIHNTGKEMAKETVRFVLEFILFSEFSLFVHRDEDFLFEFQL